MDFDQFSVISSSSFFDFFFRVSNSLTLSYLVNVEPFSGMISPQCTSFYKTQSKKTQELEGKKGCVIMINKFL